MTSVIVLITIFSLLFLPMQAQVKVWQRWTQNFVSDKVYENPYSDVTVKINFKGPGNIQFNAYCYWVGDQKYSASFSFPKEGKWSWSTSCSDDKNSGLHNKTGIVKVEKYKGNNPLYYNGFLKVSENNRYLTYDNGKPFLWMGCTAWVGPANSTFDEWKEYINDRAKKQFSVIQVTPFQKWVKSDGNNFPKQNLAGEIPFLTYFSKINPVYWEDLARKIQYANQQGLVVAITGLPGWQFYLTNPSDRKIFAQYITGLFAGNFVIFSPSGDKQYKEDNDLLARDIDSIDNRHLITQHPDTPTGKPVNTASEAYYDKPYLDFSMCQSGHNYGKRDICVWNAIHWNLSLFNREPHKPVVNAESFYHGNPNAGKAHYRGTDTDVRSIGWYSWLSGSLGYTYGALGLWNWGMTTSEVFVPWKEAMQLNSSFQMQYMSDFFSKINWWELEPYPQAILNQAQDTLKQMVFAKNKAGTLAVAYMPGNSIMEIDTKILKSAVNVQWFNPRKNSYSSFPGLLDNQNPHRFEPPGEVENDWVLLMKCK